MFIEIYFRQKRKVIRRSGPGGGLNNNLAALDSVGRMQWKKHVIQPQVWIPHRKSISLLSV